MGALRFAARSRAAQGETRMAGLLYLLNVEVVYVAELNLRVGGALRTMAEDALTRLMMSAFTLTSPR